jgi:hypothetical protein
MRPSDARGVSWALMAVLTFAVVADARAEPFRALGRLERESVEEALGQLGLAVDPSPDGKIIGRVYVVNQDVFSRHDWRLQLLNIFHRTTRPDVIERELLLSPGQRWDESLADESVRNLQAPPPLFFADDTRFAAPQLSSVVALVPVASPIPGTVDLLAVTRDLWSLRFNTEFQFQKNTLSLLQTSISENNLFGWRKLLSAGFRMDQGRYGLGPTYFDPNVLGTRLTLLGNAIAWYGRGADRYEGNSEMFSLRYPLYSLASRWGAGVDLIRQDVLVRQFCDNELCLADAGGAKLPFIYRNRTVTVDANVMRSFGQTVIQRVTAGYRFDRRRALAVPELKPDPNDPTLANAFLSRWAPLPETRSEPYLRYQLFTASYGVFRDFDTFDLRETRRLGPSLSAEVAAGVPTLGADFVAYPMTATASWATELAGTGFGLAQVQAGARATSDRFIDQRLSGVLYLATPPLGRAVRVVVAAMTDAVRGDRNQTRFFLGGDTGLRGYQIGEFQGTVQASAHAEVRTMPLAVYSQRFGLVLFYDVGHAADSYAALVPHHDLGLGLRWLIPQLNSSVFRLDWAIPTQEGPYTEAGFPGRIVAGFMQSFWLLDSPKGYLPTY